VAEEEPADDDDEEEAEAVEETDTADEDAVEAEVLDKGEVATMEVGAEGAGAMFCGSWAGSTRCRLAAVRGERDAVDVDMAEEE
jgi:hypothetical protein